MRLCTADGRDELAANERKRETRERDYAHDSEECESRSGTEWLHAAWRGGREHERDHLWAVSDKQRRFKPGMNPIRFNYVWREWPFWSNFIHKSVL